MTRKRVQLPEPERVGVVVRRPGDSRPVKLELTVADACETMRLLDFAAAVYAAVPPLGVTDMITLLRASGEQRTVDRVRATMLAAVADVVDPDGAVQAELGASA